MNTWKIILATLLIFGSGVVTGGLVVAHSERIKQRPFFQQRREANERNRVLPREVNSRPVGVQPSVPNPQANPPLGMPGGLRMELLQRMERTMNLTSGQREKIETILRESQERVRVILEPTQPQVRHEMQTARESIRQVLTRDQITKFDELMQPNKQRRADERPIPDRRLREQPRDPLAAEPQPR